NDTCTAGARDAGTKPVSNGVVTDSNGLQFNSAGTFYWQAVYRSEERRVGDNSGCQDEQLVIGKNSPAIETALSATAGAIGHTVLDSDTLIRASADAGGQVCSTPNTNDTCTAGARDAGTKPVSNGVVTDSNGLQFNSAGTFYWQAVY